MAAAESHDVELLDLVSFGHTLRHHGLVIADAKADHDIPVDVFMLLLADNTVVYKNSGDLEVVDRTHLRPGQVVGSASDDDGRLGVVTSVTTVLDLAKHAVGTHVITGVPPSTLRHVRSFNLGDFIVSGPWLGRVVEVSIDVDVLFDDGAVCRVANAESKKLQLVHDTSAGGNKTQRVYRGQMNTLFNPGQRVRAPDPSSLFKAARWLNGSWNPDRQMGTVSNLEMSGVIVYWIASMHHGTDKELVKASAPSAYQNPDDLTFFCAAHDCSWGVADRCFFRKDNATDDDECEAPTAQAEVEFPMVVVNTHTSLDVLWQDGTRQQGISSATVAPFQVVDGELFPGHHVVGVLHVDATGDHDDKTTTSVNNDIVADGTPLSRPVGVLRSLHYGDRTACVSWLNGAGEVECDDAVTVYALKRDSSYLYAYYGDIVIRLLPSGSANGEETISLIHSKKTKRAAASDLSWVGHVAELHNGHVQVKWGDGSMSMVLPQEILVVKEEHYMNLLNLMENWVVVDDKPTAAAVNTDHGLQNPADNNDVEGDNPAMTRTNPLGFASRSLFQRTGNMVARVKQYVTGNWWPLSSSPSSGLLVPTYDGDDTIETSDATMARNILDASGHYFPKGTKADDKPFGSPLP
ncbi:hypothetical protein CFC21_026509 [Triticum aestivum]|uniref:Uncharacterized protein n=2 Tax=Triticum aestivum TaxID=4565 RepID=A0A9R1EM81_WHEAT|nr:probable ubiquitin-conjugating enzyme E2 23 [Triticum aestivum]KAF7012302.1 hypothetical protein CFC21_026509 [Triticum aestivum]